MIANRTATTGCRDRLGRALSAAGHDCLIIMFLSRRRENRPYGHGMGATRKFRSAHARVTSPAIRKSETISETRTYPTTRFTVKAGMSRRFPAPPDQQDLSKFADCAGSSDDSFI